MVDLGGIASAGLPIGIHTRAVHGPRPRRIRPDEFTVPAVNVRASAYLTAQQAFGEALARDAGRSSSRSPRARWPTPTSAPRSTPPSSWQRPSGRAGGGRSSCRAITSSSMRRNGRPTQMRRWPGSRTSRERRWAPGSRTSTSTAAPWSTCRCLPCASSSGSTPRTPTLTSLIRQLQPKGVTVSIGGEIGEVGKSNSTDEELRAYLDEYSGC